MGEYTIKLINNAQDDLNHIKYYEKNLELWNNFVKYAIYKWIE